ncbi:hypothetical protein ES702_01804 [subsurface metagenome]
MDIKRWFDTKRKGILGVALVTGLIWIGEHWFRYGKIDPTFGHEWLGWVLVTISMILLALEQRSEGA